MRLIIKKIWQSELFKFLLGVVLMLVVSLLLAFNALLLWVATGPRTLEAITPYIESALSSSDGSYHVNIGQTRLIWDGWRHPVDIRLQDVSVLTKEGKTFTSFPEIALGVDVLYLPLGKIMPTSLTITSPLMNLIQNDDHSFGFGFKLENTDSVQEPAPTVPFSAVIAPFISIDSDSNFRHLHRIVIKDASLTVRNSRQETIFDARNLNFVMSRDRSRLLKLNTDADIYYRSHNLGEELSSRVHSEFLLKPNAPIMDGAVEFSEIKPDILAGLFSSDPVMSSFAVPISGKVRLSVGTNGMIQNVGVDIKGGKGTISSDKLAAPLTINSLEVNADLSNDFSELKITSGNADIDGIKLEASGSAKFFDRKAEPDASPEIMAEILIKDVPSKKIASLWPPSLSPMTREWVTENISEGKVSEDKVIINIKKGDLNKTVLPKESIDANISVEDLKIRYLPDHPPVSHVKGKIHIDGVALTSDIESADFLEKTKLSKGKVSIYDLNVDNPYITVDLHAESPAKDMVHFLGLPRLKHAEHLGLQENTVTGSVKGDAKVGFNFFAPEGKAAEEAISYEVKAEAENVSQKNFLHKFDVVGASGTISVDNKGLEFIGTGEVNGAKVSKGNFKYSFQPENGIDTDMDITASIGVEDLKRFGYPEFPFLKGTLGVNAKVQLGDNLEKTDGSLDLTDCDINFTNVLSWKKSAGEQVKLDLVTEKKDGLLKITSFAFSGKNVSAKGSAILSKDMSDFTNIKLSELAIGNNDIANLNYDKTDTGMNIDVTAKNIDLTDHMEKSSAGFSFQNFPINQLKVDIGKLIVGKTSVISNLKGDISCDQSLCRNVNLSGKTGEEKPFTIKIFSDAKKQRQLAIHSDDAGSFLHDFSVLDGMNGGTLNIGGTYSENKDGSTLKAKLDVSEHTIKDAPILGKILALASLTGFIDTLQGNGIRFKSMSMPFTLHNDVITIEKGKTYGSAIGLTIDGTITFPQKALDLQGTVVPSYSLNNVFGKVPLFGEMLTGGEDQGVFAARYSIKGLANNPEVSVNPLSILTPGFLRGLFDIFDSKPEDKSAKGKAKKYDYPQ